MVNFNPNRKTAVFYTCGTCNLRCRYCGIDKNPILAEIDKMLGKSFEGDYYLNRVKEYFPRKDMLRSFETWGGEPFLHMERLYPLLHKLIEEYPFLDSGYSSTNFSYPSWTDKFFGLMDVFGDYPDRDFYYCLQLSVDGPEYINDAGRGEGVTKRCIENFDKLVGLLKENRLPKNVQLTVTLKGTLDNSTIRDLCDKQKIIDYYLFYENEFIDKVRRLNLPNVCIINSIPNTAVPSPVTVEEGRIFAKLVRLCREIEQENETQHYFKYYTEITPFTTDMCQNCLTYKYGYHTCGTGDTTVGFLPNNMVSTCHEGFTEMAEEYKKYAATSDRVDVGTITFDKYLDEQAVNMCATDEQYKKHEYKMSLYNKDNSTARLVNNVSMIIALAMTGEIEPCFIDQANALKAAIFIQSHTSYCIKDNYNKTGSYTMVPVGLYKLLLNGAMQYIQHEGELKIEC